jgi:RNase P/RNase MRP subunit POP5
VKSVKQKVLLPTLKSRQRYVVYKVHGLRQGSFNDAHNYIISECNVMLGIFDGANAGLMGVKYNAERMTGIIRVDNKYVDKLKTCLGLIRKAYNSDVIIDCIFVSGMVNKAVSRMDA